MKDFEIKVSNTDCPDYRKGGKCTNMKRFKYSKADKLAYMTGAIHVVQQACDAAKCTRLDNEPEIGSEVNDADWTNLRPTIYIAGPYTAYKEVAIHNPIKDGICDLVVYDYTAIDANIKRARDKQIELMGLGFAVFCPHMNTAKMERDTDLSYDDFMATDIALMWKCETVYFLKGWENSRGAFKEHALALEWGNNIIYEDQVGELAKIEKLLAK